MSAPWRQVHKTFWSDPKVVDYFTPEDKFFYLYLITNEHTTQCGVYKISLKQIGFETGYSIETVKNLVERFQNGLKRIRYNPETNEIAILNWAKYNYPTTIKDNRFLCIQEEITAVKDKSLIADVLQNAVPEIRDALLMKGDVSTSDAPYKGLGSPSEAPYKPLGEEKEEEQEQKQEQKKEKEREPRAREASFPQEKPENEKPASVRLAEDWFRRFNSMTGAKTKPDSKSLELSRRLLEFLGNDLDMALLAVDYYFSHWRELWFACERWSRSGPEDLRKWEFRFASFADPENCQEILSRIARQQETKSHDSFSAARPGDDEPPIDPEENAKAWQRINEFLRQKIAAHEAAMTA
ncbi:hypothetical protein SPIROBIBN47_410021 [uncultured spirochete]|uniref:Uncharacterized protein n=1 Tax=uncultured spirochete TaxID=156406 RepID=A0A3P3XLY3_9SPIR|nr:hypothetical protein SPIROBIBN47_410021 [uncultured spirochete]